MDEDISLLGTNIDTLLQTWHCGFQNQTRPLVIQPVVEEDTQFFEFVGKAKWSNYQTVIASATGMVEQQAPLFDAMFFEWFIRRVLIKTRQISLLGGVDWGTDRSWCNAASSYAQIVLGKPKSFVPCGLIIAASIHHLNTKSMSFKKTNNDGFRLQGFYVVQYYIDTYPTWVLLDTFVKTNPLDKRNKYPWFETLNSSCVAALMLPSPLPAASTDQTTNASSISLISSSSSSSLVWFNRFGFYISVVVKLQRSCYCGCL